jgi:hypothetical protein
MPMTESELTALLDAHDSLVKSCVDSALPFAEFLALYNDFPHAYALDGHEATPDERAVLQRSHRRIAFHFQVANVLSGLVSEADLGNRPYEEAGRFAPAVGLMRLRALLRQHPDFKAEPSNTQ